MWTKLHNLQPKTIAKSSTKLLLVCAGYRAWFFSYRLMSLLFVMFSRESLDSCTSNTLIRIHRTSAAIRLCKSHRCPATKRQSVMSTETLQTLRPPLLCIKNLIIPYLQTHHLQTHLRNWFVTDYSLCRKYSIPQPL